MSEHFCIHLNLPTKNHKTGSLAAMIHAGIGNVAVGSAFATFQSLGTMPLLTVAIGALSGGVVSFFAALFV